MSAPNSGNAREQAILMEEINDWRNRLQDAKTVASQRKVVTEIIKAMSTGRDVSQLFTDILKLMQTKDFKLKKLIYIFLTSNTQSNAQQALLCVNALEMDSHDHDSAIIRANAIRTMGSVATPDTAEYFMQSVTRGLQDSDPYVRKCAATCIAKLFKVRRDSVLDQELITKLRSSLEDGNQSVVAAAAGALISILNELSPQEYQQYLGCDSEIIFSQTEVSQLLTVLSQATEWSALTILQAISKYGAVPSALDIDACVQRMEPFLRHANPAVSLNAINVMIRYCKAGILQRTDVMRIQQDCISAIISLISQNQAPEIQWIALRSLRLAVKAFQGDNPFQQIQKNIRLFFVRYNDELYVKLEKVEALALITNQESSNEVVKELAEYCEDVQPKFVRTCLRAIGQIACKNPAAADCCVTAYIKLLTGGNHDQDGNDSATGFRLPSYAAQELLVNIQDIFRTYPDRYEGTINHLCEAITSYDDPAAKASLVWILGEYCARVDSVDEILMELLEIDIEGDNPGSFPEDTVQVQLAVLNAVTKFTICGSQLEHATELFNLIMKHAARCLSPDVRCRAQYYQRLLKKNVDLAKMALFVQKPAPVFSDGLSAKLSEQLSNQLGSIPATLRELIVTRREDETEAEEIVRQFGDVEVVPVDTAEQKESVEQDNTVEVTQTEKGPHQVPDDPFADIFGSAPVDQPVAAPAAPQQAHQPEPQNSDPFGDILGGAPMAQQVTQQSPAPVASAQFTTNDCFAPGFAFLTAKDAPIRMRDNSYPLKLNVSWTRFNGAPAMLVQIKNEAQFPIQNAQLSVQPNVFGMQPMNRGLPPIPAMGLMDGGAWHMIPMVVGDELCAFPPQKMPQLDPQLHTGFNVVTFAINLPNAQYQYQTKMPAHCALTETSQWHDINRTLLDQYKANMAMQQTWANWPEAESQFAMTNEQLGVATYQEAVNQLLARIHKSNFNYINIGSEVSDYVLTMQVNVGQQPRKVMMFSKVFYREAVGGIEVRIAVRAQNDQLLVASYVAAAITAAIQAHE